MVDTLELDWEGKSEVELMTHGLDQYTADDSTAPLMGSYALNGGWFKHWQEHQGAVPRELVDALEDPRVEKWAFNAQFERVFARRVMRIRTPIKGWRCTMVLASLQSFAGSLEDVGERIGLSIDKQKLKTGRAHINMFCKPQKPTRNQPHVWRNHLTDPVEWEDFCAYNIQDTDTERAIRKRLIGFPVPDEEWELYELDQAINDRGIPVDRVFVEHALAMVVRRKAELLEEMNDMTGLQNSGSVVQLMPWIKERGYWFEDLNKETVGKALRLNQDRNVLTDDCVKILRLRLKQGRSSGSKYMSILQVIGPGDRLRYTFAMAAAGRTARWVARKPQTQNFASTPGFVEQGRLLEMATDIIRQNDYEALKLFHEEPMDLLAGITRSSFRAEEGKKLIVADFNSVETATIAWDTQCKNLLDVFAAGKDPYKAFGSVFFKVAYEAITKAQRKFSKPAVLGGVYRLGGGEERRDVRGGMWGYAENFGVMLTRQEAHAVVKTFRAWVPEVKQHWLDLEKCIERVLDFGLTYEKATPGERALMKPLTRDECRVGRTRFEYRKPYLLMWLPSGRPVYFFKPRMRVVVIQTGRLIERPSQGVFLDGVPEGQMVEDEETFEKRSFTYVGMSNAKGVKARGRWGRISSHGGKTTEQKNQANAREVQKYGLLRAGRAGFPVILHSHDEIGAEVDEHSNRFTVASLVECITRPIPSMPGLPLKADGWSGPFYKKA